MARIVEFREAERQNGKPQPSEVECHWKVLDSNQGRLVQLDTFGSKHRMKKGKQSQTLQLDRNAARELVTILRRTFGE